MPPNTFSVRLPENYHDTAKRGVGDEPKQRVRDRTAIVAFTHSWAYALPIAHGSDHVGLVGEACVGRGFAEIRRSLVRRPNKKIDMQCHIFY